MGDMNPAFNKEIDGQGEKDREMPRSIFLYFNGKEKGKVGLQL